MTLRIGMSSGAVFPEIPTELVFAEAAHLGILDVELMLQAPSEHLPEFFRTCREASRQFGVQVKSLHALQRFHPVFDGYARRRQDGWDMFERLLEGASTLGADFVVWHGACPTYDGEVSPAVFEDQLFELSRRCNQRGLKLAVENVSWCRVATVRDVLSLAAILPSNGNIGFTFDPFQASVAGANPFMMLAAMEGHLIHVHLRDFDGDPGSRTLLPGEGELPWPALIKAIGNTGFDGPMMLEGSLLGDGVKRMNAVKELLEPLLQSEVTEREQCEGRLPPGVREGINLFNTGRYYECHEVIEHEWHAERRQVRRLYQGILQIGVGFHHVRNGNHRGAVALLSDGIAKVSDFLPRCRGVDTARLVDASMRCLEQVSVLGPEDIDEFDWSTVPVIELD